MEQLATARLIDGKLIAQQVRDEVAAQVAARTTAGKRMPTLATVLVGDRVDSATYVASKQKACAELGMTSLSEHLPMDVSQDALEKVIKRLNRSKKIHGILVQLPLPAHLNEERVLQLIGIEKDVDGFSPLNIGRLAQKGREPLFVPCTPFGCIYLLEKAGVQIEGANAVVVSQHRRRRIAPHRPQRHATVCHSRMRIALAARSAGRYSIAAIGKAELVRGDWIKPGAAVIDVGINSKPDASKKSGYRLVGDVNFDEAKTVAGCITPVPGGVGPMTIAMLMKNTLRAAEIQEP
jgi:5,10-methylene-tetrahydrofolate dehydrogenase/methenyl tetrahydrofolate cyclohydrolase